MSQPSPAQSPRLHERVANRDQLSRDELIALVAELHALVPDQPAPSTRRRAAADARAEPTPQEQGAAQSAAPVSTAVQRTEQSWQRQAYSVQGSDFTIVFDGGSRGNPGKGYGSYQIVDDNGVVVHEKLEYPGRITNNQAELMTVIAALEALEPHLVYDIAETTISIRGDSQLAVNTIAGRWKARHPNVVPLVNHAKSLLARYEVVDIQWQSRLESYAVLGH